MKCVSGLAAALLATMVAGLARADPRLDEKVYDPYVQNGVAELEVRAGRVNGGPLDGTATTMVEAEYGVSDRVSLALVGVVSRGPGEASKLSGVGAEAVVYVGQIPGVGVDVGVYGEYKIGLNGATDVFEGKLLLAKTKGRFQGLANLIVEEPVGAPRGEGYAAYGYAASATWRTVGALRIGVEAVGDFGDDHRLGGRQGAYVGPQVKWEGRIGRSPVELGIDAGWLAAVGESRAEARSQVRIALELERRF
ncbi:MAG: hypothetical protein ABI376_05165 [Caulobacteraceae bacterium]